MRRGGLRRLRKGLGLLALLAVLSPVAAAAAPLAYLGASVFDPVSLSVAASIPLRIQAVHPAGTLAYGFVVPPAGSTAPGTTPERAVLGALDTRTNTVVATALMPFEPAGLALDPGGTRLYVTGRVSGSPAAPARGAALVIEPVTLGVLASIELGPAVNTSAPLLHPTAPLLYVFRDTTIDVIDTGSNGIIASIQVPTSEGRFSSPFFHPSGNFIYASTTRFLAGPSFALVIDTRINTLVRTVPLGSDSVGAILPRGPDNALLFTTGIVLPTGRTGAAVFDAASGEQIASLALPGIPVTAAAHPAGRAVYYSFQTCLIPSCNLTSAGVAVVDGGTLEVTAQIPAGSNPGETRPPARAPAPVLSLDPPRGLLYAHGASLQTIDLVKDALLADVPFSAVPGPGGLVERFVFGPEREAAPGPRIFYALGSAGGRAAEAWGEAGDQPVPADYDGDGRADVAVWRPRQGTVEGVWFIHRSSDGAGTGQQWGAAAFRDQPVPADYDGDGRADVAVWRRVEGVPALGGREGIWYIVRSSDGLAVSQQWGASGDVPVPADYDGDGRADIAVWRAGTWYIIGSADGAVRTEVLGEATDVPVPADYDGDGRADLAVWRPSTGAWWIVSSRDGSLTQRGWGAPGDLPVPADYDGDGRADLAVWRSSTGEWWIVSSRNGAVTRRQWGAPGDRPVPADYDGDGLPDLTVYRP